MQNRSTHAHLSFTGYSVMLIRLLSFHIIVTANLYSLTIETPLFRSCGGLVFNIGYM